MAASINVNQHVLRDRQRRRAAHTIELWIPTVLPPSRDLDTRCPASGHGSGTTGGLGPPVRDSDIRSVQKTRVRVKARMQQRTRVLNRLLPALTTTAADRRRWVHDLLSTAEKTSHGEEFIVDGVVYRRHYTPATTVPWSRCCASQRRKPTSNASSR
ncbi:hypothetical protein ACWF82_28815 [Nocardia sp. NPDC055053]